MTVEPWFAQPPAPRGTVVLLPGNAFGVATPVMHWPATLLTQQGWSALAVAWGPPAGLGPGEVCRLAQEALDRADPDRPVLIVAKSLGTLALPWAVERDLPGVWLTPVLGSAAVAGAVRAARAPTLLVGGTADEHWRPVAGPGPGVRVLEIPGADHGLQRPGDWRTSALDQIAMGEVVEGFASGLLGGG